MDNKHIQLQKDDELTILNAVLKWQYLGQQYFFFKWCQIFHYGVIFLSIKKQFKQYNIENFKYRCYSWSVAIIVAMIIFFLMPSLFLCLEILEWRHDIAIIKYIMFALLPSCFFARRHFFPLLFTRISCRLNFSRWFSLLNQRRQVR